MDENRQSRIFVIKIDSIRLPRFLPSVLFITWRVDTLAGQTKMIQANSPLKQIGDNFEIPIPNTMDVNFSLQAKTPLGALFRIGESTLKIPETIGDMKEHYESFTIQSETGDFIISISFRLKDIDKSMEYDPQFSILLQGQSTLSSYGELVDRIPYSVGMSKAKSTFYSDDGILAQLCGVGSKEPNYETNQTLNGLLPVLQTKIAKSKFEADIMIKASSLVMRETPLFLLEDLRLIDGNEARDEESFKISLYGIYLCSVLDNFQNGKNFIEGLDVESIILSMVDFITKIDSNKSATDQWRVYMISSSLILLKFISDKYPEKFMATQTILEQGIRNAIIIYIERYKPEMSQMCHNPNRIKTLLNLKRNFFRSFNVPDVVFTEITNYFYSMIDYYFVKKIIYDDKSYLTKSFNINQFKDLMPDYHWPLMNGLVFIVNNINEIYAGKIKLADITPNSLAGVFLKEILLGFSSQEGSKMTVRKIENLMKNQSQEPAVKNIDEWAHESLRFVDKFSLPSNLQNYIDNITDIMKKVD